MPPTVIWKKISKKIEIWRNTATFSMGKPTARASRAYSCLASPSLRMPFRFKLIFKYIDTGAHGQVLDKKDFFGDLMGCNASRPQTATEAAGGGLRRI